MLYHLSEKQVVPVGKQMKRSIFLALVIVNKWYRNFREFQSKREKGNTSKGVTFFPKTFHRDEPSHLNSPRNYQKFHSKAKVSAHCQPSLTLSSFPLPGNTPCKDSWDLLIDFPHSSCPVEYGRNIFLLNFTHCHR